MTPPARAVRPGVAPYRTGAVLVTTLMLGTTGLGPRTALPARVETYLNSADRLSAEGRTLLIRGQPVTKLLDADESKEVAVLGAVWIDAPMGRYVETVTESNTSRPAEASK